MEPLKIEIEVKLSPETLETLKNCVVALSSAVMTNNIATALTRSAAEEVIGASRDIVNGKQNESEQKPATVEQKPAAVEQKPAAVEQPADPIEPEQPADDLPVSDEELAQAVREAVARAKAKKIAPSAIRTEIFKKYNINQSVECPPIHRGELLKDLGNFAK